MKDLVQFIARALVDVPDAVELKVSSVDGATLYELRVAPGDVGKVIGRDGRTVNAMRTVLQHAALKKGEKARLEIIDERKGGNAGAVETKAVTALPAVEA
jgi:predicted RNA-binding protein YlqC (UPF0109 family)